jgi:hypothetical protein
VGGSTREYSARTFRQIGVGARMHSLGHRHAERIPGKMRRRSESN